MAQGERYQIPRNGKNVIFREYKLPQNEQFKGLKQVAREQLGDESKYVDILIKVRPLDSTTTWYAEIPEPKDRIDPNWTLLLPVIDNATPPSPQPQPGGFAQFILQTPQYVRTSPVVDPGNIFNNQKFPVPSQWTYKTNNIVRDSANRVWVDITTTNIGKKTPGVTYWICVKEGSVFYTKPPIS